jgi:tetratricopeptide (TPR) repeat protein
MTDSEQTKLDKTIQTEILKPRTEVEIVGDEFERPEEHLTKEERTALEYITNDEQPTAILKKAIAGKLSPPALERALEGLVRKGLISTKTEGKITSYSKTQALGSIEEEIIEEKEEREPEDTSNDLHALLSRSRKFIESGRYKDAASTLKKALKINPYDDLTICLMAQVQYEMGERDKAINTISKILSRKPDYIPAWFTLANATLKGGAYTDAVECFRKILELQPDNAEARKGLEASEKALK